MKIPESKEELKLELKRGDLMVIFLPVGVHDDTIQLWDAITGKHDRTNS